ncbi:tripartite tricarboxylate transporter TctB family protein [Fusobacterium sp. PH5-44]|uniref:tripartite tricarboxylate transporter TctB family protein n=1 Tax=unclassified Fusobacterium TaxID=2648384 RepID=UPI003D1CDE76
MKDKTRDTLCSMLFLLFGAFMFSQAMGIVPKMGKDLGSGFMPKIIGGSLIAISALKLVLTFLSKENKKEEANNSDMKGGLLTIGILAIYVILFNGLGFLIATAIYLFFQMLILSDKKNRNIILFAIIAIIVPVIIYVLFVYIIKMPLPAGLIEI